MPSSKFSWGEIWSVTIWKASCIVSLVFEGKEVSLERRNSVMERKIFAHAHAGGVHSSGWCCFLWWRCLLLLMLGHYRDKQNLFISINRTFNVTGRRTDDMMRVEWIGCVITCCKHCNYVFWNISCRYSLPASQVIQKQKRVQLQRLFLNEFRMVEEEEGNGAEKGNQLRHLRFFGFFGSLRWKDLFDFSCMARWLEMQ